MGVDHLPPPVSVVSFNLDQGSHPWMDAALVAMVAGRKATQLESTAGQYIVSGRGAFRRRGQSDIQRWHSSATEHRNRREAVQSAPQIAHHDRLSGIHAQIRRLHAPCGVTDHGQ